MRRSKTSRGHKSAHMGCQSQSEDLGETAETRHSSNSAETPGVLRKWSVAYLEF